LPKLDAPAPVSAVFSVPFGQLDVTFSHPIRFHAPNDVANWFVRIGNQSKTIGGISVGPAIVSIQLSPGAGDPGPNVVSYSPPPADVVSNTTKPIPAPAFADFPIT
jgi:hypothetical protein